MLQIGLFVAPVAPWHDTRRVRSWQWRRGGQNPGDTRRIPLNTENSEEPNRKGYKPVTCYPLAHHVNDNVELGWFL